LQEAPFLKFKPRYFRIIKRDNRTIFKDSLPTIYNQTYLVLPRVFPRKIITMGYKGEIFGKYSVFKINIGKRLKFPKLV